MVVNIFNCSYNIIELLCFQIDIIKLIYVFQWHYLICITYLWKRMFSLWVSIFFLQIRACFDS